jgi:hypothetical protein
LQESGAEPVQEFAELELGRTEGGLFGAEEPGHAQEVVASGLGEAVGELLGLSFLFGGEGIRHGRLAE